MKLGGNGAEYLICGVVYLKLIRDVLNYFFYNRTLRLSVRLR